MEDSKKNDEEEVNNTNNLLADAQLAGGRRARMVHGVKWRPKRRDIVVYQHTKPEGPKKINETVLSMEKRYISMEERYMSLEKRYLSLEKRYTSLEKRYKKVARSTKKPKIGDV